MLHSMSIDIHEFPVITNLSFLLLPQVYFSNFQSTTVNKFAQEVLNSLCFNE